MQSDQVEAICRTLEKIRIDGKTADNSIYWRHGPGIRIGEQIQTQIAFHIVKKKLRMSAAAFSRRIYDDYNAETTNREHIPQRNSGPRDVSGAISKRMDFSQNTYAEWLRHTEKSRPTGKNLTAVTSNVLSTADKILNEHLKHGKSLEAFLASFEGTISQAIHHVLDFLLEPNLAIDWTIFTEPMIWGEIPHDDVRSTSLINNSAHYETVVSALLDQRSVQVLGPSYSGKHDLLRKVVATSAKNGFETASGARIPVCAMSLHDVSAPEAVEIIAKFYGGALRIGQIGESSEEHLLTISHCARNFPALFVLGGMEATNDNEIVRALNQEVLGEAISRILAGHGDTRILLSTSTNSDIAKGGRKRRRWDAAMDERHAIAFDHVETLTDNKIPAVNFEYRAIRQAAEALSNRDARSTESDVESLLGGLYWADELLQVRAVPGKTLTTLGNQIACQSLRPEELSCLAVVALCHDGLSEPSLRAIVQALRQLSPDDRDWAFDPVAILAGLPVEIIRKPREASSKHGTRHYFPERALRIHLLKAWRDKSVERFGRTCWIIARHLAGEARSARVRAGLEVSAGRDVQTLILLLASATGVAHAGTRISLASEDDILPDLSDPSRPMPSDEDIVGYAFEALFDQDLARSVQDGVPVLNDARLRLAAAFPFFDNRHPWQVTEGLVDPASWSPRMKSHPWTALDRATRLRLIEFATAAASRLDQHALVSKLTRLAEQQGIPGGLTATEFGLLARVQRYEVDLGILLARNPDARPVLDDQARDEAPDLESVERRVQDLIDQIPAEIATSNEALAARIKLEGRRVEILHLRGKLTGAYREMLKTLSRATLADARGRRFDRLLAGRSRRMFTRLLVELARSRLLGGRQHPTRYDDGLVLPALRPPAVKPKPLIVAERLAAQSLRALSLGRGSDWIGVKIDQARISAAQLKFAEALQYLNDARQFVRARGAMRDLILELMSVQCRILVEAAAFSMAAGGSPEPSRKTDMAEVARMATLLRLPAPETESESQDHANAVSEALCDRAAEALTTLTALVEKPQSAGSRYAIFANYLGAWVSIVRSRQWVRGAHSDEEIAAAVRSHLEDAAAQLEKVLIAMYRTGYFMHSREAAMLVRALSGVGLTVKIPHGFPIGLPLRSPPETE